MRLLLAYGHYDQFYVGGLLKRAARRLGIDVVSAGPLRGDWLAGAPPEPDSAPEVLLDSPCDIDRVARGPFDAVVSVDQGDGFRVNTAGFGVPHGWITTEGNEGEYERGAGSGAQALWSLMPLKPAGRRVPGLLHLTWGYDPVYTPLTPPEAMRSSVLSLRGTPSPYREEIAAALRTLDIPTRFGPPVSRAQWGAEMRESHIVLCDHDEGFLSGRVVDAMAAGCLVLAKPSPSMDMLAPRGYAPMSRGADGWPAINDVIETVSAYRKHRREWIATAREGQRCIARLTWDAQLLRILGSIGIRT